MSHTPNISSKYDDNEGSGPRPRPPGQESQITKMTEGVSDSSSNRNSPPSSGLNWALNLSNLLEDRDGVELLIRYVGEEVPIYNDYLNFYFACEGLKQQTDPDKIKPIIGAIYRKYLRKGCTISITENFRHTIKTGLKNEIPLGSNIFDPLQKNVEITIRDKIYPNFLTSEVYIKYVREMSQIVERCSGSSEASSISGTGGSSGIGGVAGDNSCSASSTSNILPATSSATLSNIGPCGGFYGPSTSASSSGSISATDTLPRSSTLPTLHEDSELSITNEFETLKVTEGRSGPGSGNDIPMRLTRDLLLATQKRRLEIRPPGAIGYFYKPNLPTSYNPCSRVDSERGSVSSGGRTDSDTMSLSSCSMDGRPYVQRKHTSSENKAIRQNALANKETNSFQVIPRTQRLHNEHRPLKENELISLLIPKLEEVKRKQDIDERARSERFISDDVQSSNICSTSGVIGFTSDREFAEAIRQKFALEEDNDQDILDQHVSRVWQDLTPHRSPGTMSPCPPLPTRRRTSTQDSGMMSDGATSTSTHSMRHSKSMPEHSSSSKRLTNKWPSMNTDSGISLFSADTLMKYKDSSSRPTSSTTTQLEEAKRRLEDETRRSRRYAQQRISNINPNQMQAAVSSSSSGSSSLHQLQLPIAPSQQPPPLPAKPQETTTVVFSFYDEDCPYRSKIPGTQPTLKQFKDYLPKKGNYRFFFKTNCEDPDSPIIQEERVNDSDLLPLYDGKVMGFLKPFD